MQGHKLARWTLYWQLIITLLLMLCGGFFVGRAFAYSIFLGGLVVIIPGMLFTYYAFSHRGARAAQQIVYDFYKGSLLKFISMAVLFVAILSFIHVDNVAFMFSFIISQLLSIVIPLTWHRLEGK